MSTPESIYLPDGDGFVATELARGPWDPNAQHRHLVSPAGCRSWGGEEISPLMRVAAAADFGNGVSGVVDWNPAPSGGFRLTPPNSAI
jgi:hypothetical protein